MGGSPDKKNIPQDISGEAECIDKPTILGHSDLHIHSSLLDFTSDENVGVLSLDCEIKRVLMRLQ